MSLKQKTFIGSLWHFLRTSSINIINFITFAVLARFLSIEEFGLVLFCLLVVEFANVFANSGINLYLIQRKTWQHEFSSSSFLFTFVLSLSVSLILLLLGSSIAFFVHSYEAMLVIASMSIIPILVGTQTTFSAKLEREFKNKQIMYVSTFASLVYGVLTVYLVIIGFGLWSLVIGKIAQHFIMLVFLVKVSKFYPRFCLKIAHVKDIVTFGLPLIYVGILDFLNHKAINLITGIFLGNDLFALLSVAKKGQDVLSNVIMTPINKMVVPVFSRVDNNYRTVSYYRLLSVSSAFVFPAFMGMAAISDPFIPLVFDVKYEQSSYFLSILCFGIFALLPAWFLPNLVVACGYPKTTFKLKLISVIILFVTALISAQFGLVVLVIAASIIPYALLPIMLFFVQKHLYVTLFEIVKLTTASALSSILMFLIIKGIIFSEFLGFNEYLELCVCIIVGLITYPTLFFMLFKRRCKETVSECKSLITRQTEH